MKRAAAYAVALLATAAVTFGAVRPALSCGFHGLLGDAFAAQYSGSIEVAVALREAADAGLLEGSLVRPRLSDLTAYQRTVRRLLALRGALDAAYETTERPLPAFAVLLIESRLWSRVSSAEAMDVHVTGPEDGETVVITGDAVVAAMLDGRLGAAEALERRQLLIDGAQSKRVRALLDHAFPSKKASAADSPFSSSSTPRSPDALQMR